MIKNNAQWAQESITTLVDHIESTHHEFLKREMPIIENMLDHLNVHASRHDAELCRTIIAPLLRVFHGLRQELEQHLFKEERILFPYIRQLDAFCHQQGGEPCIPCGTSVGPIQQMEFEHQIAANALREIRELTGNYECPQSSNFLFEACFKKMQEFDLDLTQHMGLENDLLFPRTAQLESDGFPPKHLHS